jgi:hypothetical protein
VIQQKLDRRLAATRDANPTKDVLIGADTIVIRHCIPISAPTPPDRRPSVPKAAPEGSPNLQNYLLRKGRDNASMRLANT